MSFPSLSGEQDDPVDMEEVLGVTELQDLRLVVIGNTGTGKSASANKILGRRQFLSKLSATSVTRKCQYGSTDLVEDDDQKRMRSITVVDMPGFGDTHLSKEEIHTEIAKCLSVSAPGPHAFLLVVPIGPRYTDHEKQAVTNLANIFGGDAVKHHTVVLFTRGDDLEDMEIEEYLKESPAGLKELIDMCGGRYQVFDNKNARNVAQVKELVTKVDRMVKQSKTGFYTNAMFEEAEAAIREEQRRMMLEHRQQEELELEDNKKEKKHVSHWPRKRKFQRLDEKSEHRGSSQNSKKTREEALLSLKVLEKLKRMVAAGLVGLAVGVAFGIAVPLVAAASASLVGNAFGLAAVQLTGASAVGVGNTVGTVVAAASGKTALAVGAAAGALVGGSIGVVAGSEAESVKEGACETLEQVRGVGAFAVGAAVGVGAALGTGAALSAALVPHGASGASVAHGGLTSVAGQNAPASVGALAAETATTSSAAAAAEVVQAAPVATKGWSTPDTVTAVVKAVAAVASSGGIKLKVVKYKSQDSEKTSYKFSWNK
ncbi:uncharacterized protein LOC144004418 [Festucalex cinctus]